MQAPAATQRAGFQKLKFVLLGLGIAAVLAAGVVTLQLDDAGDTATAARPVRTEQTGPSYETYQFQEQNTQLPNRQPVLKRQPNVSPEAY